MLSLSAALLSVTSVWGQGFSPYGATSSSRSTLVQVQAPQSAAPATATAPTATKSPTVRTMPTAPSVPSATAAPNSAAASAYLAPSTMPETRTPGLGIPVVQSTLGTPGTMLNAPLGNAPSTFGRGPAPVLTNDGLMLSSSQRPTPMKAKATAPSSARPVFSPSVSTHSAVPRVVQGIAPIPSPPPVASPQLATEPPTIAPPATSSAGTTAIAAPSPTTLTPTPATSTSPSASMTPTAPLAATPMTTPTPTAGMPNAATPTLAMPTAPAASMPAATSAPGGTASRGAASSSAVTNSSTPQRTPSIYELAMPPGYQDKSGYSLPPVSDAPSERILQFRKPAQLEPESEPTLPTSRLAPGRLTSTQADPPVKSITSIDFEIITTLPPPERIFQLDSESKVQERIKQKILAANMRVTEADYRFPDKPILSRVNYELPKNPRRVLEVEPPYVCYRRLYFEDKNHERYGWDLGFVQPFVSAMAFYKDVVFLPYRFATEPCRRYESSAGYCLPGDPVPYLLYPPNWSISGGILEAGVTVALFAMIP